MARDRVVDFFLYEGRGLAAAGLVVLTLIVLVVGLTRNGNFPPVTYGDVANGVIAVVAVASLYIAWRELIRKTRPNITVHFDYEFPKEEAIKERMFLKLTNSGANVVTPISVWYAAIERDGDEYHFLRENIREFDQTGLQPGDTTQVEIGENIVMIQITHVGIRDWRGDGLVIEDLPQGNTRNRSHIANPEGDIQVRIQKLFSIAMDHPTVGGARFTEDELLSSTVDEIVEGRGWKDEVVFKGAE